jgi:hypothetical protein
MKAMRLRGARTATLCALIALVGAGTARGGPKPDPPPLPPPPPPPAAPQPQPQPQPPPAPVQPAAPVAVAPTRPTSAELAASRRAAAARARKARVKAERLRAARIAALKRQERQRLSAARAAARADRDVAPAATAGSGTWDALPFLLAGLVAALLVLAVAMTPAAAVPWSRAARALEDRREEVAVAGAMGLLATGLFFFFVTVVAR